MTIMRKKTRSIAICVSIAMLFLSLPFTGDVPAAAPPDKTQKVRMAVFYFDNESLTDKASLEPLRKGLADTLIGDLNRLNKFQIVERAKIESLMMELKLSQSGLVDTATAQRLGKLLGAQLLVMGSFTVIGDMIRIDARIVEAQTGVVVKAEEVSGNKADIFALEEALVAKITDDETGKQKGEKKPQLHSGGGQIPFPALMHYSQGLEYFDAGRYAEAARAFERSLEAAPEYQDAGERLKEVRGRMGGKEDGTSKSRRKAGQITVAVFPLEDISPSADSQGLGESIAGNINEALSRTETIKVVDRIQIKKQLGDVAFRKARSLDQNAAVWTGRLLGAQCLVLGSFLRSRDQIRINTKIVKTETGEILSTGKISGKVADLPALQKNLVEQMISGLKSP